MKKTQLNETKLLDTKALMALVRKTRIEIDDLVLDKNMSKLKDLKSISKKRKDLAQVLTVLKQKTLLETLESKNEQSSSANKKVEEPKEEIAA